MHGVIANSRTSTIPPRNPYRAILRRDYPEPLIALLAFVLGIWLWDHYFGKPEGYPPGTGQMALVKIDRDLRLADAMTEDPAWLRWLAGVEDPKSARSDAMQAFAKLAAQNDLTPGDLEAFAAIKAAQEKRSAVQVLAGVMKEQPVLDLGTLSAKLANHRGTWWDARFAADLEKSTPPVNFWRSSYGKDSRQLWTRAVFARSSIWFLGLLGLVFIPGTLRTLRAGCHAKPRGYGGAWPVSLGLTVFLVATLAWIGFTTALQIGIDALPGIHPALGILLDSAARILPPLIALGLLFRRPSHAFRVLGLNRPFATKTILGLFSLLMILDQLLRVTLGSGANTEPGGGLSANEAGLLGLAFAIISACLLAPFAEELFYRGILFRSLWNRLGVLPAALLSAAMFSIVHFYDGYGLASVGIFGFSCALLYAATGSLGAPIALHFLYNSAIKIPEWLIYHCKLG